MIVHALATGFGLGFLVSMQLGPMSLFLVRSTLRNGAPTGLAVGAGVAVVDGAYASLGAAGAAPLLAAGPLRLVLGMTGTLVLLALGLRTLATAFRVRNGHEGPGDVASPRRAFLTSLAGTASNPLTIASWAAIFAAASVGTGASARLLVPGVAAGSLAWTTMLVIAVAVLRRGAGRRAVRAADTVSAIGMIGFAGLLGWRTAHLSG